MNSKDLIIQVDIDKGTQWGNNNTINPIREIFIPSVKSYCKKFNYDWNDPCCGSYAFFSQC